jgi:hypothetical protein
VRRYFARPVFYGLTYDNGPEEILRNKYVYIIKTFLGVSPSRDVAAKKTDKSDKTDKTDKSDKFEDVTNWVLSAHIEDDGKLKMGSNTLLIMADEKYYFYVSDMPVDDPLKIKEHHCSPPIEIQRTPSQKIKLYPGKYKIGDYTKDKAEAMEVTIYGYGAQKGSLPIQGECQKAIFLIGGLHSDESGGRRAIKIMEDHIRKNPSFVLIDTNVFVLNPASITNKREINGKDPNRHFMDNPLLLSELKAITGFISKLITSYNGLTIISAHSYDDTFSNPGRQNGTGIVFPLYNLTEEGRKRAVKNANPNTKSKETFQDDRNLYSIPESSKNLRKAFLNHMKTNFKEMDLFDNVALYGELIYYIDFYFSNTNVKMIEFETPKTFAPDKVEELWGGGFKNFIRELVGGKINA